MKKDHVPQDNNPTYQGYGTKVIYAVDDGGDYTTVKSSGWEAEEIVLIDVVNDFKERAHEAKERILSDKASPIEYFMHLKLMDPAALASGLGVAKWRVRRHLTARGFRRLDRKMLQCYAVFFDIPAIFLTHFKDHFTIGQDDTLQP